MKKSIMLLLLASVCIFLSSCSTKSEKITNQRQLDNKRICVLTGSAGDLAARAAFPKAKILDMVAPADAALAIKTGKADAFIYDKSLLLNIVAKDPDLILLDQPVAKLSVAAALKKGNNILLDDINSCIDKLKDDGTLDKMKQKWIDSKYKTTPGLPSIDVNSQEDILRMGTCAILEPFSFKSGNNITGYDIELALRIGEILGKKIEIIDMNFEGLIPALEAGKIDFAMANFNVTEERKKLINFSDAYISNDISILVKK